MPHIIGYTYKAENYTPEGIVNALGWSLAPSADERTVEVFLTEEAESLGIDRMDESSFNSDDFPKVIFSTDDANL